MTENPLTDPRATPLGRAVTALDDRIRRSMIVELHPGMIGQPFAATMPELARDAVSAALDVEELARELFVLYAVQVRWVAPSRARIEWDASAEWVRDKYRGIAHGLRTAILGADQ